MGKLYDKEKIELVKDFYEDIFSYGHNYGAMIIVALLSEIITIFFVWLMTMGNEMREMTSVIFCAGFWPALYVILPYLSVKENDKQVSVFKKIKYLPVSVKEVVTFLLIKYVRFKIPSLVIMLVGNMTFVANDVGISVGTFVYPVLLGLLYPLVCGSLLFLCIKK